MSPVSRGRKKQQQRTRGRPGATRPAPSKGELLDGMLRTFQKTVRATDPLEAETLASGILGALREQLPHGEDAEATIGMELVDQVAHARTPRAVALLRALAAVGTTGPLRAAARSAAEELVAGGVADPLWAAAAGRVDVGECWRLGDVYGDQASLLCTFGTGTRPHGLLALLDFNHLDGWVKDVFVTDDPAGALRSLREAAASEPLATLEPIDPAAARLLLEDGFAATDITWQPEVSDEFRQYRALALARCRAIPAPAKPAAEDQEIDEAEREAIVAEFLASPQGGALPADDATRFCARLLVDYGADYGSGGPLRVSPARTEAFLHDWLPRKAVLDDADRAAVPAVVTAWVRWAGERAGLPDEALVELVGVATECGGHFDEAYEEGAGNSPARLFLQGLDPGAGLAEVQDALDRRMFTMPFFGTRIGDEDFPSLDPGDPDERRLLIEGEHPEYHDALDDPLFDGELDGVNPRLHLAMHEVAANQLWDDDPPEAWRAAKRLQAAGVDRHEILHQLTWVAAEHLHGALSSKQSVDPEAYAAALDTLRPPASGRGAGGRRAAGRAPRRRGERAAAPHGSVYQVKITLLGASPPIWRRLHLPADTSLAALHQVIQTAFGWDDCHLHAFEAEDGERYAPAAFGLEDTVDTSGVRLRDLVPGAGARVRYTYDFGDDWEHELLFEHALPADGVEHAVCVAGRRAGPPEDCGGVWGYAELCAILADPGHPEHEERAEWLGQDHDPAAFDKDAITTALARIPLA